MPLSLPLSCRHSLSHFQSLRGCIKGPGFSPNQHSVFHAKPPPLCSAGELLHEGSRVNWKLCSACKLMCRSWLDVKTGRFPISGGEKQLLLRTLSYPFWCLALYSTLWWGLSQTVKQKQNTDFQNRTCMILRCKVSNRVPCQFALLERRIVGSIKSL